MENLLQDANTPEDALSDPAPTGNDPKSLEVHVAGNSWTESLTKQRTSVLDPRRIGAQPPMLNDPVKDLLADIVSLDIGNDRPPIELTIELFVNRSGV